MGIDQCTLIACLTAIVACADTPVQPPPSPAGIQIVAGAGQVRAAGAALRTAPTVRVLDANGQPIKSVAVTFAARRNSVVNPVVAFTDRDGLVSTQWNARSDGGEDTLVAKVDSLSPAIFTATSLAFTEISAGASHTCGVVTGGRVFCWGANVFGELATGDSTATRLPAQVTGTTRFAQYVIGGHTSCGLTTDGQAFCAGLSRAQPEYGAVPQAEGGALRFTKLMASEAGVVCGVALDKTGYCWAIRPFAGYQPSPAGTYPGTTSPFEVIPGGPVSDLAVQSSPTSAFSEPYGNVCATRQSDTIVCVDPFNWSVFIPPTVATASSAPLLAAGAASLCFGDASGAIACRRGSGPVLQERLLAPALRISVGLDRACALTLQGVYCWDAGTTLPALQPGTSGKDFQRISVSSRHVCALDATPRVWCWGANDNGQLGDGTTDSSAVPRQVNFDP